MAKKTIEEQLVEPKIIQHPIKKTDWLSTGSTLLNMALSGTPDGGFTKGRYFWLAGDSSSGKTFLTMTCFAEAARNPNWSKYDLIFDNVEDGALMSIEKFFGAKMAAKLQPPKWDDGLPAYSKTAEEFYFNLDDRLDAVEAGKSPPFLYLLDSMDSLSTKYEGKKFDEKKTEFEGGAKAKGDYGDGKAALNSKYLRTVVGRLRDTGCTLIIISQTRDNIDGGMFDPDSIAAGGRALKFYAAAQLWSVCGSKITKDVNGTVRQIGINSRVTVKKNRLTGKEWTVEIPIYHSYGIDDIGACVDWILKEKHWEGSTQKFTAPEFSFEGNRQKLIRKIESEGLEFDLRSVVADVWQEIDEKCTLQRKPRYE
jgi:RecA/RadA recombinase